MRVTFAGVDEDVDPLHILAFAQDEYERGRKQLDDGASLGIPRLWNEHPAPELRMISTAYDKGYETGYRGARDAYLRWIRNGLVGGGFGPEDLDRQAWTLVYPDVHEDEVSVVNAFVGYLEGWDIGTDDTVRELKEPDRND